MLKLYDSLLKMGTRFSLRNLLLRILVSMVLCLLLFCSNSFFQSLQLTLPTLSSGFPISFAYIFVICWWCTGERIGALNIVASNAAEVKVFFGLPIWNLESIFSPLPKKNKKTEKQKTKSAFFFLPCVYVYQASLTQFLCLLVLCVRVVRRSVLRYFLCNFSIETWQPT